MFRRNRENSTRPCKRRNTMTCCCLLRPFDAATPDDLSDASQAAMRRQYLLTVLRAGAAAKRIDRRLKHNLGYRLVKRVLQGPPRQAAHHH